jgi:hypothetical protein
MDAILDRLHAKHEPHVVETRITHLPANVILNLRPLYQPGAPKRPP